MVLLFKGIAPPSQFPATIASGAPPRPNHAVFKTELVYVSKPFGGSRGGEGVCTTCTTSFSKKKFSPRTSAHNVHTYNKGGQNQNWPTSGRKCYITLAFSGIPKHRGAKSELAHKWAEMLHNPCILGDPQIRGHKIRIGCLSPAFWGGHTTPAFSGIPNKGDNIKAQGKTKKTKKEFSILPLTLSGVLLITPLGIEPMTLELWRHCFTH